MSVSSRIKQGSPYDVLNESALWQLLCSLRQAISNLRLCRRYGISVLVVKRGDQAYRDDVPRNLRAGYTMVLHPGRPVKTVAL